MFECTLIKRRRKREAEVGVDEGGSLLGLPVISLMAFWSSQLDNKLCITTSTDIKTLGVRNDGCFSDPYKFAWGQNNCSSLLLGLLPSSPLSQPGQRREGLFSRVCQHYLSCR